MKALIERLTVPPKRLSPATTLVCGVLMTLALGALGYSMPFGTSLTLFYLLTIAFVAWGAGKWPVILVATLATAVLAVVEWCVWPASHKWAVLWNALTRAIAFTATGWLTAEAVRLARHLGRLVEERTGKWKIEADQRQATSMRLAEALERFQQVTDNITEVFWLRDVDNNQIIYVSPGYERIWGRPCDELYREPLSWLAGLFPEDRERIRQQFSQEQIAGCYDVEYRVTRPDGSLRWIRDRAFPVRNETGQVYRVAGIAEDITERKLAETALREREELTRNILATAMDGFFLVDPQTRIVDVNDAFCRMVGYSREELLRMRVPDLEAEETAAEVAVHRQRILERGFDRFETRNRRRDGGKIRIEVSLACLGGGYIFGFVRDISDRKNAEFLLLAQRNLGIQLSQTSDLKPALEYLLDQVIQMEGVDCGGVYLASPTTRELNLATHRGLSSGFISGVSHYPADAPETALVYKGQPVYALHAALPNAENPLREQEQLLALAVLPLCHEDVVLGSLNIASHSHREIPAQTRTVLEAIAAQAAGAIARIRAQEALKQSEARLRTIVTGVPIILFAADQNGILTFEHGDALRSLGVPPGTRVGRSMKEYFRESPQILENIDRVLRGEEFSSVVQVGDLFFDCWYSPTRDNDGNITGYIGVALDITERQRLERQILEISDREQARLGQDIHDGLCQKLVSLAFDANALDRELSAQSRPEAAIAARIAALLDESITEARQLSRGLFPVRLESDGLASALEELANTTRERFRIECIFESNGPVVVANKVVATHLYRIAQEAVNNALKHGRAKLIFLRLQTSHEGIELDVQDNGVGIAARPPGKLGGMGLHIMDYRARSLGGTLRLSSLLGGGTLLSCCIPHQRS